MIDRKAIPAMAGNTKTETITPVKPKSRHNKSTMSKSMHDGVEVWYDCCSCEAEPYWIEAMKDYDKIP
jgi:hypothetical protein